MAIQNLPSLFTGFQLACLQQACPRVNTYKESCQGGSVNNWIGLENPTIMQRLLFYRILGNAQRKLGYSAHGKMFCEVLMVVEGTLLRLFKSFTKQSSLHGSKSVANETQSYPPLQLIECKMRERMEL